jgi:hypothetical protein
VVQKTPKKGEITMVDTSIPVAINVNVFAIENLVKRLEIVADHLDTTHHQPMVGTIYEAAEFFRNLIDSAKPK